MWPYLAMGMAYGFAAAVQPGPLLAYLASRTLARGWRRTLPACFAPLLSDGPIALLALLALRRVPVAMVQWLHILGGGFVLYLAWAAARTWRKSGGQDLRAPGAPSGSAGSLSQATLVNILNPGPYLGWTLVLGPLLLTGWREAPSRGVALVAGFYGTMITIMAGIVLLLHTARRIGPGVSRILLGLSALALAGFGLVQLWLGLPAFASLVSALRGGR